MSKAFSQAAIARAIGISVTNLRKHLAKPDAPSPTADKKYVLSDVAEFIQRERKNDLARKGMDSTASKAKAALTMYRARLLELKYKREMKELIPIRDVEEQMYENNLLVRHAIRTLHTRLPPLLMGKDMASMVGIIQDVCNDVLSHLASLTPERAREVTETLELNAAHEKRMQEETPAKGCQNKKDQEKLTVDT